MRRIWPGTVCDCKSIGLALCRHKLHGEHASFHRCEGLSDEFQSDCLILAGDISDDIDTFRATLLCFTKKYKVMVCICYSSC